MDLQRLVPLFLLLYSGQVLLCTLLQHLFILMMTGHGGQAHRRKSKEGWGPRGLTDVGVTPDHRVLPPIRRGWPSRAPHGAPNLPQLPYHAGLALPVPRTPAHLAEALQDLLHLLISPEEISQRFLHGVQVGQGLLLLQDQLLDGLVGDRLLPLFILWWETQGTK